MKICTSIVGGTYQEIKAIVSRSEMIEFRFDKLPYDPDDLAPLPGYPIPIIATFRKDDIPDKTRAHILKKAVEAGAEYVDIDINNSREFRHTIMEYIKETGKKTIISYHNFEETPDNETLLKTIDRAVILGADIVKIACMANTEEDNSRLLALYSKRTIPLVITAMGTKGKITRLASLFLGAPFNYAAPDEGIKAAPGQMYASELKDCRDKII